MNGPALTIGLFIFTACKLNEKKSAAEWQVFGGSKENTHYSALTEIDTSNIQNLKVAWEYHTGDADTANHSQMQCNPIIVDGIMYVTSPQLKLVALDAGTGAAKWVFNPFDSSDGKPHINFVINNNRGVTYWTDGSEKRIFYTAGSYLFSVDANTGKPASAFGVNGKIDLHEGLGLDVKDLMVTATSPGIIYKDLYIIGSRVSEGSDAAPGHIRAYDVRTGKEKWIFHTIPYPGEFGYDTWEDSIAYKNIGGANCWSGFSMDEKRGIVFASTGSASFDFYGGKRKGAGLFADCMLAIDAATGKRIWHFQEVHHDVWDRDLPTPPALVTIERDGKKIDAVAQPTKSGFVFVLDRETGKSLFPINETPVPSESTIPGEKLWPTQPVPTLPKPFARQLLTENDLNNLVPDSSYRDIKKKFEGYKSSTMFNPPSREGTIIFPGFDGGAEWGGPSYDPSTGILYVNANEMAWVLTIIDAPKSESKKENFGTAGRRIYLQNCVACHGPERKGSGNYPSLIGVDKKYTLLQVIDLLKSGRRMMPSFQQLSDDEKKAVASFVLNDKKIVSQKFEPPVKAIDSFRTLPYTTTGYNKFLTKEGYPAVKPPWGTLNAINLNTGAYAWKITLGEYPEFLAKGIQTGTENYGGSVVTKGGILFIAATRDGKFRAFNKRNGKLLWETNLPHPGFATPATYKVNGKQYIVVACGGGKLGTGSGDSYVAFALP
ncbi:MAG: pyrrolo-quinoline quinone [Bacteroidetes bacterium]|nr:MAG: pyrrolo-quinoline quinone [Bacteroidota bacterium]